MGSNKGIIFRRLLAPYADYKSSGPRLHVQENRMYIDCIDTTHSGNHKLGILYARYLYEVTHRAFIPNGYDIDHIDGDKTNDDIANLQAIPSRLNNAKGGRICDIVNSHCARNVLLRCPICGKWFDAPRIKYENAKKNGKVIYCSRNCTWEGLRCKFKVVQACIEYKSIPEQPYKHNHPKFEDYSEPYEELIITNPCAVCGTPIPTKQKMCGECYLKSKFPQAAMDATVSVIEQSYEMFNRLNMVWCGKALNKSDNAIKKRCIRLFGNNYKTILDNKYMRVRSAMDSTSASEADNSSSSLDGRTNGT